MPRDIDAARVTYLLSALAEYGVARERMLGVLGPRLSHRDPLAEFAEHFVASLLGGRLADNPVQAGWDVQLEDGGKVQVKYLINKADSSVTAWVNEHEVRMPRGLDWYALVIMEGFAVAGVVMFRAGLRPVYEALGKKHPHPDTTLQFGRRNWLAIRDDPDRFREHGVQVWVPPFNARTGGSHRS